MLSHIIQVPTKCGQNHEMKYNNTLTHAQWIVKDKYPFPATLFLTKALYTALLSTISQYLLNSQCRELTYLITHKNVDNSFSQKHSGIKGGHDLSVLG